MAITGDFILRCLVSLTSLSHQCICMCVCVCMCVQRSMDNWIFCVRHHLNIEIFSNPYLLSLLNFLKLIFIELCIFLSFKILTVYKSRLLGISNNSSLLSLTSPIFSSIPQCFPFLCLISLLYDCSISDNIMLIWLLSQEIIFLMDLLGNKQLDRIH